MMAASALMRPCHDLDSDLPYCAVSDSGGVDGDGVHVGHVRVLKTCWASWRQSVSVERGCWGHRRLWQPSPVLWHQQKYRAAGGTTILNTAGAADFGPRLHELLAGCWVALNMDRAVHLCITVITTLR